MNKRIMSFAIALIMCMAMVAPAMADYTMDKGSVTPARFYKFLVMDENAVIPNTTFTFTVDAASGAELTGNDNTANGTSFKVEAGILEGLQLISESGDAASSYSIDLRFGVNNGEDSIGDATDYAGYQQQAEPKDSVDLEQGEKYSKGTITLDFSNVQFPKPGVYRYKITESANPDNGITNDPNDRYLDVYVIDVSDTTGNKLQIAGYTFTTSANELTRKDVDAGETGTVGGTAAGKDDSFENEYTTYDLTVGKTVAGNQGNREQDFKFTVSFDAGTATPGTYKVTYSPDGAATDNPTTITVNTNGTTVPSAIEINLKHGETFTIENLPPKAVYNISEVYGDYVPTYIATIGGTAGESASGYSYRNALTADTSLAFTNTRQGAIPTGILMTIAPFAALMVVGVIGVVVIMAKKRSAR